MFLLSSPYPQTFKICILIKLYLWLNVLQELMFLSICMKAGELEECSQGRKRNKYILFGSRSCDFKMDVHQILYLLNVMVTNWLALTMRSDCLQWLRRILYIPYSQSAIWMATNKLLSFMVPSYRMDCLYVEKLRIHSINKNN